MAVPVKCAMPADVDINTSYQLVIAALSPTDGSAVSGVTFSNMSIECDDLAGGDGSGLVVGPYMLVPGPNA